MSTKPWEYNWEEEKPFLIAKFIGFDNNVGDGGHYRFEPIKWMVDDDSPLKGYSEIRKYRIDEDEPLGLYSKGEIVAIRFYNTPFVRREKYIGEGKSIKVFKLEEDREENSGQPPSNDFDNLCAQLNRYGCGQVAKRVVQTALLGLCTKQITVFHGPSGTGKSFFAEKLAKALDAGFTMCEVQSNWTDKSDLLGYFIPRGKDDSYFVSTPFLEALLAAKDDPSKLHIICLDEMNLAHVEYYFATFLSAMQRKDAVIEALPPSISADEYPGLSKYERFTLPDNVRFIGTMNNDDTTKALSPKVIDRCIFVDFGYYEGEEEVQANNASPDDEVRFNLEKFSFDAGKRAKNPFDLKLTETFEGLNESHRFSNFCSCAKAASDAWGMIDEPGLKDIIRLSKVLPTIRDLPRNGGTIDALKKDMGVGDGNGDRSTFTEQKLESMRKNGRRSISYF